MSHPRRAPEQGFSLIIILLTMLVLSFLALGAMNSAVVQERMAGNARDRNVALQAAEAALRDAEADIEANADAANGFTEDCTGGLCIPPSDTASGPKSAPVWQTIDWAAKGRAYGSRTGAPAVPGPGNEALATQPRYIIERLPTLPPRSGDTACVGGGCGNAPTDKARAYRITARASGVNASTVVMLQSVYVKQ
ncbi:PilX N-terminal domain-containing pilus assembly protein [Ideonella sp. DXS22W]|uniref:PilX N-terminal domain-containing pilus assembly protein n=1 Tax=Pseudaquabacterium inlustre TaxID=2984192 RepID=A0ABU9CEL0_9BURK